ncbi:MAG: acyl-CoA desaturase [Chloroflexi bacterium]|nr:MAG: acyl-CoA desaturase [Chloroflexota bacterium]
MAGTAKSEVSQTGPTLTVPKNINPQASYAALKKQIKDKGLLEKQPRYVIRRAIINVVMFAFSITILFVTDLVWVQVFNALFLAFLFVQFGFIAHDVGHRQAFRHTKTNNIFGLIHAPLMLGMSFGWWMDKHNEHHSHPNVQDMDPDIDFPFIAFSEEDALTKRGLFRWMVKQQAYLFPFLVMFESFSLRFGSVEFLIKKQWKYRLLEVFLMILHFVWFFSLIFAALPTGTAVLFIVIQQAFFGLYLASVFAPNHKGMLIVDENMKLDFMLKQILTARNVESHWITDYWYGGLNFQIEHHLFPTMAENKLREAQKIIKQFCADHRIPYYETSVARSYVEIMQYLHQIGSVLRKSPVPSSG